MNDIIRNNAPIKEETLFNFVISNYKQILLLLVVAVIVYWVEYMAHVNTLLYGMLSMPAYQVLQTPRQFPLIRRKKRQQNEFNYFSRVSLLSLRTV